MKSKIKTSIIMADKKTREAARLFLETQPSGTTAQELRAPAMRIRLWASQMPKGDYQYMIESACGLKEKINKQ